MPGDEYDALLEEPFGEDVDWTAIDGMNAPEGLNFPAAGAQALARSTSESDGYFNDDDVLDESFLNEVRRLEDQVIAATAAANAPLPARNPVSLSTGSSSRPFQPNWGLLAPNPGETSSSAGSSSENSAPDVGRSAMGLGPRSPQTTLLAAQINPLPSDPPPSSWVLIEDRAQTAFFLDPPPSTSASTTSTAVDPPPNTRLSPSTPPKTSRQASVTRKRRRSSDSCSDAVSSRLKTQSNPKQKTLKFMEAIEKTLECPICFDTIAASHIFACGHSGCGLCLCEWIRIKGDNATCCVCRAPHKGPLLPNYTLDEVAGSYFDERKKFRQHGLDEIDFNDKRRWEERKAEGKAAVTTAAKKQVRATAANPAGPILQYDSGEEYVFENIYEDAYYDYDIY